MNRKVKLVLWVMFILVISLACAFVQSVISGEEQETAPTIEVLQEENATEAQEIPGDDSDTTIQELEEKLPLETGAQQDKDKGVPTLAETEQYDTAFPLPENVQNFMDMGDNSVNFQTSLSIEDSIAFYRQAFKAEKLTERTQNTAITETTFSMIFDGHPDGTIVIQGVDLGDGTTNINIRFEDV